MKKRYLFKAKRIDNGEWVQGNLIQSCDATDGWETIIIPIKNSNMFTKHIKRGYGNLGFENWYRVDPSTICQCTGLKDENGNLIWENDIIHKPFYTDYDAYANSEAYTGRIQYEDGGWSVEITKSDGRVCISPIIDMIAYSKDVEHFEIIGNIFDIPAAGEEVNNGQKENNGVSGKTPYIG